MSILQRLFATIVVLALIGGVSYGAWRIVTHKTAATAATKPPPPAITNKVSEADLGTVQLTEEAAERLGVKVAPISNKKVRRARMYGGEAAVPAGRTIIVAAPLGGTLQAIEGGMPAPGKNVTKGQPLLSLLPLFSAEASTTLATTKADVEGQVKNAQTMAGAAKLALDRAQRLYAQEAGSKRVVEETQAQYDLALRGVEAAQARLDVLTKALGDAENGRSTPIAITAPESGIVRNVSALPGQNVPSGGMLLEIVDLSEIWVRVPVYVGDLTELVTDQNATIGALQGRAGESTWQATPVAAPPSANPLTATVDIYYALPNSEAKLIPGQRVGVTLALKGDGENLTLPVGAVVYDVQGNTWVYVVTGERKYQRKRVVVRYNIEGDAILAAGPPAGTNVVVEGAIELFGAETGFSK